jgi:hypothetical protein
MAQPWGSTNDVGYAPAFLRGMHLVHDGEATRAQGSKGDGEGGGGSARTSTTISEGGRRHCEFACGGALLLALAGMLLDAVVPPQHLPAETQRCLTPQRCGDRVGKEPGQSRRHRCGDDERGDPSEPAPAFGHVRAPPAAAFAYVVDACVADYTAVPCPLYPVLKTGAASVGGVETGGHGGPPTLLGAWSEYGCGDRSRNDDAEVSPELREARSARAATLRDKFFAELGEAATATLNKSEPASILSSPPASAVAVASALLATWREGFDHGGASGCRGAVEYARFVGPEWCAAALDGPGGFRAATQGADAHVASEGEPRAAANPGPLGSWCALPARGHFSLRIAK